MIYDLKLLVYSLASQRAVQSWLNRSDVELKRAGMAPEQTKHVALGLRGGFSWRPVGRISVVFQVVAIQYT